MPTSTRIGFGHVAQPLAEDLREGWLGRDGRLDQAHRRVELAGAVVVDRIGLGQLVAVALLRDHMQELRARHVAQVLQRRNQRVEVVAVDRADVVEAELLEDRAGHDHALGMLLEATRQLEQRRRVLQHRLRTLARSGVELAAHQARQVAVERADRRADRHVVVVEHHQHVGRQPAVRHRRVVQRLEGHAGGHRAVADDRHRLARLAFQLGGQRHAERGRDRSRTVRGAEGVVLAFVATREAADAAELAQRVHAVAPAGEDLVRVGLVADVPHQAVVGGVEDVVQRDRQLDRAEVARQVAAGLRHALQHELAQLDGQRASARRATAVAGRPGCRCVLSSEVVVMEAFIDQLSRSTTLSASSARRAASARPLRPAPACGLIAQLDAHGGARPSRPSTET